MSITHIDTVLALIRDCAKREDYEAAHRHEDILYHSFAEFVFKDAPATSLYELRLMAKRILESKKIVFTRECA